MSIVCTDTTTTEFTTKLYPSFPNSNTESPARDGIFQSLLNEEEVDFPTLPALHRGHPEVHLRNGVMNALCMSALNVPDAERAFLVADLSQVYRQHERWKTHLPEIRPYYG